MTKTAKDLYRTARLGEPTIATPELKDAFKTIDALAAYKTELKTNTSDFTATMRACWSNRHA